MSDTRRFSARSPRSLISDEVYGRDPALRTFCEDPDHNLGYVLEVPCSYRVNLPHRGTLRADRAALLVGADGWNHRSAGPGSKGERTYQSAWIATTSPRHHLLIRRSLTDPTELTYFHTYVPPDRPLTLPTLVRVAGMRWPVEEDLCATRRPVVFPTQLGGTRREVPGSDGLPGAERLRGQEHARKPVVVPRRMGRGAGGPA